MYCSSFLCVCREFGRVTYYPLFYSQQIQIMEISLLPSLHLLWLNVSGGKFCFYIFCTHLLSHVCHKNIKNQNTTKTVQLGVTSIIAGESERFHMHTKLITSLQSTESLYEILVWLSFHWYTKRSKEYLQQQDDLPSTALCHICVFNVFWTTMEVYDKEK